MFDVLNRTSRHRHYLLPLLNVFFPHFCRGCGDRILTEEHAFFCPTCWDLSPRIERPFCSICGRPHPRTVGMMNPTIFPCGPCAAKPGRFPFRRALGAAYFTGAVAETIKLLKFHKRVRALDPLAALMRECAGRELDVSEYTHVVPVPLHRVRERSRGFNQSRLLVEALLPLFPNAALDETLRRTRPTKTQSLLTDHKERARNVRGAFELVGDTAHLKDARVLLIDDVVTSYGTVSECATALLRGGAAHVDVFCAAIGTAP